MRKTLNRYARCSAVLAALAAVAALLPANASAQPPPGRRSCAERPGYPLGRWGADTNRATPGTYSTFVTFTGPSSGVWLPSRGKGSFQASVSPAPGQAVVLTLRAEPGTYQSENQLVVSADGCSMTGTFLDTEGHSGEVTYRWQGDAPPAAEAPAAPKTYRNVATGLCLDSNAERAVYALGCNGGNYQNWKRDGLTLRNVSTGFCLDSNPEGKVYTLGCNGGDYQKWESRGQCLVNVATGKCLDSNPGGAVYTLACNGGNYQNWNLSVGTGRDSSTTHLALCARSVTATAGARA